MAENIDQVILSELEKAAVEHEIDIVDVEVVGSSKNPIVRVRIDLIDSDTPIDLDQVAANNMWISELLDEIDPFENAYTLEVSSPGCARPLRKARDFERFAGEEINLKTTMGEGKRRFTGRLLGITDNVIQVEVEGSVKEFDINELNYCKLNPTFDLK